MEPLYGNIETASAVSQASYVSEAIHKTQPQERPPTKPRSFFMKLLGRGDPVLNDEGNERRKEAFIEDAMDREKVNFMFWKLRFSYLPIHEFADSDERAEECSGPR